MACVYCLWRDGGGGLFFFACFSRVDGFLSFTSQRLMHWAREYILSMAPGSGIGGHGHLSPRPPKPHEVLMAAWEYTIGEKARLNVPFDWLVRELETAFDWLIRELNTASDWLIWK